MKMATYTAVALLLSAGYALAADTNSMTSGHPSAVMDDAKCQNVWKMASPNGEALSGDKAVPYVLNFQMVDTAKDGKISADEFKAGCAKGWIQSADAATTKDMKGTPAHN
jgi:hypothetical protein